MYAIVVGNLQKGEDFQEIEYKEIARAENAEDLLPTWYEVMGYDLYDPNDPENQTFLRMLKQNEVKGEKPFLLSTPERTLTFWGKDAVKESKKGAKDGYGLRVRMIEVE